MVSVIFKIMLFKKVKFYPSQILLNLWSIDPIVNKYLHSKGQ